jgi:hypothetical protein
LYNHLANVGIRGKFKSHAMRLSIAVSGLISCLVVVEAASAKLNKRKDCAPNFTSCQPSGSSRTTLPPAGSDLSTLFGSLLTSVKGIRAKRDGAVSAELSKRDSPRICCADGTRCLNLADFNIPFCYDRFTTNFVLADGSSGTLDSGNLDIKDGPRVNMLDGSYSGAGQSGNIYGGSPPDTATLPIPTPYTSSGVGSAIPITGLANIITVTSTVPGTTVGPTTLEATTEEVTLTLSPTTTVVAPTTQVISGTTEVISGTTRIVSAATITTQSTRPPTTISGTTVNPKTLTYTTSGAGNSATGNGAAPMATHIIGLGAVGAVVAVLAGI